jgi:uncharacterized membrane protein YgcG
MFKIIIKMLLVCVFLTGIRVSPLWAQERIYSFDSNVTVEKDGNLLVTETIKVKTEGDQIKHGIYRDFPTTYKTENGLTYRVSFNILSVQRDGQSENYFTSRLKNGVRVYFGRKDFYVPPGDYNYIFQYRTKGQIGFFKDHDELYWNVTGNGWVFPIDSASCTISLPEGIKKDSIKTDGFTGLFGAKGKLFACNIMSANEIRFWTTRNLEKNEGLTVVAGFNKGVLTEPTIIQKLMLNYSDLLIVLILLFITLSYYLIFWFFYGRDPKKGVIIPRFEPPKGISAAGMRYIKKMGHDQKVFATAIVDMATKGYLTISNDKKKSLEGTYSIKSRNIDQTILSEDEKVIAENLPHLEEGFRFKNTNAKTIQKVIALFNAKLSSIYKNKYFITNYKFSLPGFLISIICIIFAGIINASSVGKFFFLTFWLSIWTLGVVFLLVAAIFLWKKVFTKQSSFTLPAIFITLFSIPFVIGECAGLSFLAEETTIYFPVFLLLSILLNVLFYFLLKAPTKLGRKALNEIEGLKHFLTVSEKESIEYAVKIDKALFEKLMPYAMALDVENKWSDKFALALQAAGQELTAYQPVWLTGPDFGSAFKGGSFASNFSSSFTGAISSASTPPGSSSGFSGGGGGGGGSSGGGGGGGGGGGW